MLKASLKRLITLQFSIIQMLVPLIEREYGRSDGPELIHDVGRELRAILQSVDEPEYSRTTETCPRCTDRQETLP